MLQQDYTEQGRRVITTGTDGQSTYQFNGNNQLTSATYPTGDTVQYAYDEYGRKTGITYPDGSAIQYAYDQMDRLSSVTEANGSITRYSYNALGQRTEEAREGQSLRTTYAYDAAGNLLRQETQGKTALAFGYAYDALGRMVKEERTEGGARLTSEYRYDKLGQLLEMTASDGYAEAYQYDAAGNMVRKQADGVRYSMRYGKANELTELRAGNQKLVYSYDENGNLREKALGGQTDQYTYDGLGNLSSYTGYDGYAQSYAYAGLGIRTEKQEKGNGNRLTLEEVLAGKTLGVPDADSTMQGVTTQGNASKNSESWTKTSYIQDVTQPHAQVLMEQTGGSTTSYVYGLDRLAGYTREADGNTLTTEYVYDGRGSVAQILTTGEVKAPEGAKPAATLLETLSLRYSPYGEQISAGPGSKTKAAVSGYGYNSEAYDAATGMLHLRARQYEPAINRFSQKDLVWGHVRQPMTQNRYAYVTNNPVNLIDPSGMWIADPADDSVRIRVNSQTGVSYSASSAKTPTDALTAADIPYLSDRGLLRDPESYGPVIDDSSYASSSYTRSAADIAYAQDIQRRQAEARELAQARTAATQSIAMIAEGTDQFRYLTKAEQQAVVDAQQAVKNASVADLKAINEKIYGYCKTATERMDRESRINDMMERMLVAVEKTIVQREELGALKEERDSLFHVWESIGLTTTLNGNTMGDNFLKWYNYYGNSEEKDPKGTYEKQIEHLRKGIEDGLRETSSPLYIILGSFDPFGVHRSEAMMDNPSVENVLNWLTVGYANAFDKAIGSPAELSTWINSFSLVAELFALYTVFGGTSVLNPSLPDGHLPYDVPTYGYDRWGDGGASNGDGVPTPGPTLGPPTPPLNETDITKPVENIEGAQGLIGREFEDFLTKNLGGEGSFKLGGREFDGGVGNQWWEAKSGQYWDMLISNEREMSKFKSDLPAHRRIAEANGASFELFSNTPIPDVVKDWLNTKDIPFTEILK